jgi:protein-S-isoprenylcysteine O-methyltransferase Ste14
MAFRANEQPTTSSPPPQVITPTITVTTPEGSQNMMQKTTDNTPEHVQEIVAPEGVHAGIPLSELKKEVEQQQALEEPAAPVNEAPNKMAEYVLVGVQIVALIVIIIGFIPPLLWQNTLLQVVGMLCIGLAIFIGIWAALSFKQKIHITPSPGENSFLVTGGPYAFIRHPLYFALLIGSFGLLIAYPTIPRLVAVGVLAAVLYIKITYEEKLLQKRFNGYEKYKRNTGAILPKLFRATTNQTTTHLAQPEDSKNE